MASGGSGLEAAHGACPQLGRGCAHTDHLRPVGERAASPCLQASFDIVEDTFGADATVLTQPTQPS